MRTRSRITTLVLSGVAVGMLGLAYASVPLYKLFCQVTGYGGTTQRADAAPSEIRAETAAWAKVIKAANIKAE